MGRKTCRRCIRNTNFKRIDEYGGSLDLLLPPDGIIHALDDSFNRQYDYRCLDGSWQLPLPTHFFREGSWAWHDDELMSMKSRLNDVKGRLSSVDIVTWQNHTQVCYLYIALATVPSRRHAYPQCTMLLRW